MVVHAYYPLAEPRVEREAKAARDAGYHVEVISLRQPGEAPVESIEGIMVHRLPLRHRRGAGIVRLAFEYVTFTLRAATEVNRIDRQRPIDIVQIHTPPDFLALAGLPIKLRGRRLILDIHDISPHLYRARFSSAASSRLAFGLLTLIERAACKLADTVVTVHEPYRRELISHGVPDRKIAVVMNTPDEALVEPALAARTAEPGASETFTVAYHGTITDWYGVDLIVDVIARLDGEVPGLRAVILGDGDALPRVRESALRLGVADRVSFSGRYVPIADALREVARADCGVIPNRPSLLNRFALSSKLFEYIALEVPVVVSRLETLESHFGDDEVTFFEPGDALSLAEAVRWVATHPKEAQAKTRRATERAADYSWKRQRERYLSLLR